MGIMLLTKVILDLLFILFPDFALGVNKKAQLVNTEDLQEKLPLPEGWDMYLDINRQGCQVAGPIKVKPLLRFTPKNAVCDWRMPVELITLDFYKEPVQVQDA